MYVDSLLEFSDSQALTATAVSTNVVPVGPNISRGQPMAVVVTFGVAADYTSSDETYQVSIQTDALASMGSPTVIASSGVINGDQLTAGAKIVVPIGFSNEPFLRLSYVLAGTTPSATVDASLMPMNMIDSYDSYADNVVIL
tara:strand:- start:10321 stop:10746 length:426 start_codon:yes stop_codon:yes gene_type:complete